MRRREGALDENLATAVREAVEMLECEGIDYRLVGTAALQLLGFDTPVGEDVDLLCTEAPEGAEHGYSLEEQAAGAPEPQKTALPSGGKADFIDNQDEGYKAFWTPPEDVVIVPLTRPGEARAFYVKVAGLSDVLGLKAWARRPKDRAFFDTFVAG
jgi:predicted nucleotidyltransferase